MRSRIGPGAAKRDDPTTRPTPTPSFDGKRHGDIKPQPSADVAITSTLEAADFIAVSSPATGDTPQLEYYTASNKLCERKSRANHRSLMATLVLGLGSLFHIV